VSLENYSDMMHDHSFTYFRARFSSGEGRGRSSPRRTRNASRFSKISGSSAGSTRRQNKAGDVV